MEAFRIINLNAPHGKKSCMVYFCWKSIFHATKIIISATQYHHISASGAFQSSLHPTHSHFTDGERVLLIQRVFLVRDISSVSEKENGACGGPELVLVLCILLTSRACLILFKYIELSLQI
ncbi:unnamed protein product [Albugo candida]|uniref:Uncharacterized protein n=1 Tax=Albugo candida TaxID=65357 RepID=A0A024FV79_9STRA|nr:unnamed protein product [Albugo candida]|eukprot:CCI10837.1 unnamed protein product [Albugo candida]